MKVKSSFPVKNTIPTNTDQYINKQYWSRTNLRKHKLSLSVPTDIKKNNENILWTLSQ